MKVLSLFDGISCGRAALEHAGIPVTEYAAFEIDKFAVQTSSKNYPDIQRFGNVFEGDFARFKGYDLLLGGSPCTYWSIAKKGREITPDGMGGQLFMEYVRALHKSGCKYFLYENNYSIHKNIKAFITEQLGVQPIMINSALVSAQQRKRCYWTNIPNVTQPADKNIMLGDILDKAVPWQGKSYCLTANYGAAYPKNTLERHQRTMVAVPVRIGDIGSNSQGHRVYAVDGKSVSLSANGGGQGGGTGLYAVPVMRVNEGTKKGFAEISPGECVDLAYANSRTRRGRTMREKSNCLTTSCEFYQYCGTVEKPIYTVENGFTEIDGKPYPIKIKDGCYIIRKLSPVECERLQTLPDNYTEGVSNAQRYKQLGNGWTVDVIAHILSFLPC
ncbi:MAG: DNA cytosine methyltransferase [Ruminococcus sp.]|nr:DNA cytosine methyltransferase [Ruminococcus sp.]